MLLTVRGASTAAKVLAVLTLAGCGGDDGGADPVEGPAKDVAAAVDALEQATAARDFDRICRDLLSEAVRAQAGGPDCPALLRRTSADLRDPRIRVERIQMKGARATVRVRTRARGQADAPDVIELVREDGRWRVAALGARADED